MESLDKIEQNVIHEAHSIASISIHKMRNLWSEIFDEHTCQYHLSLLPEHIQTFFNEVYEESEVRKRKILEAIESLRQEAANLKRLLREDDLDLGYDTAMPLRSVQISLDRNLESMREKLKLRHDQIDEFLFEQETLCEELGECPRELSKDPLPSESEMQTFRAYLDGLREEKLQRFDDIAAMRREIKMLMGYLDIAPQSDRQDELVNARNFPPTRQNLTDLRHLHESICSQFEHLKDSIDRMRTKLQQLWKYLAIRPSVVKKFEKYNDYTQAIYDKLFTEVDRCETMRRENIQAFVDRTREEIVQWWDKCLKSAEERARFSTFKSDVYNEDLLTLHEMELNDLKEYYRNNEVIFQLVEQRKDMWDKMTVLEQKSNDPSRYNNRGGKLLEEEKERKRISIQLPKIEMRLLEACKQYEEETKRKFTIFGENVEDVIQEQWKKREEGKLMISSARKKANMGTPNAANKTSTIVRTPRTAETMLKHSSVISRSRLVASQANMKGSSSKKHSPAVLSSAVLKRKLPSPKTTGAVKRSLLKDLNGSVKGFLKPGAPVSATKNRSNAKSPGRIPTIKVYETKGGTSAAQKRRSSRRKSQNKQRRSVSKVRPEIVITSSSDNTIQSESVSYEHFENFFEQNTPNRSSLMPARRAAAQGATMISAGSRAINRRYQRNNGTLLRSNNNALGTPSKITFRTAPSASSTMLATTIRSPGMVNITSSGKKLTAASKNCPIIF